MANVINKMTAWSQSMRQAMADGERTFVARSLPVGRRAPGIARVWMNETLARWGVTVSGEDVASVLTELVTNALQAKAEGIRVLVEWYESSERLEVCVWDDAPGEPVVREPDFVAEQGRGLYMVEALTAEWGHRPAADGVGKVVWAVFGAVSDR